MKKYRTAYRQEKERRDMRVYNDYRSRIRDKSNNKSVVIASLMAKYGIHSTSTIYAIFRRVERSLGLGTGQSVVNRTQADKNQ